MKISDILKNSTDESRYLIYLIQQFNSQITYKYKSLFENREHRLEILLNEGYYKIKKSVDIAMLEIYDKIDSLDINNLNKEDMDIIAKKMDELIAYLQYYSSTNNPSRTASDQRGLCTK